MSSGGAGPSGPRREVLAGMSRREATAALTLLAVVSALSALLSRLADVGETWQQTLAHLGLAGLLAVAAVAVARSWVPAVAVGWVEAGAAAVAVAVLAAEAAAASSPVTLAYALVVVAVAPAFVVAAAPAVTAVVFMAACVTAASGAVPPGRPAWLALLAFAAAAGLVLMQVRRRGLAELARALDRNRHLAFRDPLTGALNRRGLSQLAAPVLAGAARDDREVFVVFADVDGLKVANDRHGHAFGDQLIRACGQALLLGVRDADLVARWGGDEFIVVGLGGARDAHLVRERVQAALATPGGASASAETTSVPVRATFGVAVGQPRDVDGLLTLVGQADAEMYRHRQARGR